MSESRRDILDGIVIVLDYLGVRAVAFMDDSDGDSGVFCPGRNRTFTVTNPLVLTDTNLASAWAVAVATMARGVRA